MARTDQLLGLLIFLARTVLAFEDDDLGPPISGEEIAIAMADTDLNVSPGDPYVIENSGEYQGDIKLTPAQQSEIHKARSATSIKNRLWKNGEIPYTISAVFSTSQRQVIGRAMAEYQAKTCLRFVGRTNQKDYIHIISGSGCWSYIGRVGGKQELSLKKTGCVYLGIVIHEFMHAAGFHHEQSRYDRNNYVTINWHNILSGVDYNFDKQSKSSTTDLGLQYDYGSVMHYGAYAFSKNGKPTITSKQAGVTLGQREGFSKLDVAGLNKMYKCEGSDCTDSNKHCQSWANIGECEKNPDWMVTNCPKSCNQCDKSQLIQLSKDNIIDHGGFGNGGAGPEYLLTEDDFWNPNPKPWFVIFDFGKVYTVNRVKLINHGDSIHDVTRFTIEVSDDTSQWTLVKDINNVATGHKQPQYFTVSGEARYWKLSIKSTASKYQPWLRFFGFYGKISPISCKDKNQNCIYWKNEGYCQTQAYKAYMQKNCQKACKYC